MDDYLRRQREGQTAAKCPPAAPPPQPRSPDPPAQPLPPASPPPLVRVFPGNRMSVHGRELRLDGQAWIMRPNPNPNPNRNPNPNPNPNPNQAWIMRGICYSPVPVGHDP